MYGADVGHGVRGYFVKVGFGEGQGEGEDAQETLAEGEHGAVVAVECGSPEEG